ncbi:MULTISPECIES: twin-arginine translocase subunit TatC [unclassified Streptomyces]|uniref:twin-arginine translocase subunit TatC n=1 Tax=unclassified Streptomyces TaxID=2593676 RepID=UPI002ED12B29|nr:twin-arginine translocase subunit TatC [Streptomyces sp. NBC_00891]WSY04582.1 twin-arginine translocase subunit TatC [Streptomyces sp. NBC_00890]WSZ06207.1 twin-arginine translocase subunit TatC [Streptomyces sp. NBC_00869]WSZ26297.1 twin-arginine translocase subunit TatC [Streptomyces sp. NBC_00870]
MLKSARKQEKDSEGRMPLADHLRELRNRLLIAVVAILVITSITAFFYQDLITFLIKPILESVGCAHGEARQLNGKPCAEMTVNGIVAPFSIALKVSLMAGVVISSPVWLYQLWAFLAPGLHKHEKRYALSFVGVGAPLFLAGATLAYVLMPQTASVLQEFTPDDTKPLLPVDEYLDFITRMVVVFGLAFELPLLLVLLNFTGILTAKRLASWWRWMVMGITIFAAVATPTGDPLTMITLAAPIVLLYYLALGVCMANDRRRKRNNPDADLDDDEASELDLTPEDIGDMEQVAASPTVPGQADGERDGGRSSLRDGYDDIT